MASPLPLLFASAFVLANVTLAGALTPMRVAALSDEERLAWEDYVSRSRAAARADQAAVEAELAAQTPRAATTRAPDGPDFKMPSPFGDAWHGTATAQKLADIVLSYQTPSGGWSKHTDYSQGTRKPGMLWSSQYAPGKSPHYLATFDNGSTTGQMRFLAAAAHATRRDDCKGAFIRGLRFILDSQYPAGGWPQVYPIEGGYHDNITYNDDVMTSILELLRDIANGDERYAFVDAALREKSAVALAAGLRCVVATQYVNSSGRKTVWCAQHDPLTLLPAAARKMEPAMLSGHESANLLKFLMTLKNPPPEIVASIEAGLAWLDEVRVTGITRVRRDGKTLYVPDPESTEVYWARFYDPLDNRPVFPGRDGVIYGSFTEMAAAGHGHGYSYYSTLPGSVFNTAQKKWRKQLAAGAGRGKSKSHR
ncbi:pectate lyase [Ereboglobus luteus]|nr:pectate lyase [Ereboglobus luteus]